MAAGGPTSACAELRRPWRRATRRLGVDTDHQGPFGGGLSTEVLTERVRARGLGCMARTYCHPTDRRSRGIRARTARPFAGTCGCRARPGRGELYEAGYDRVARLLEPYFAELGIRSLPHRDVVERFDDQVEALLAAAPPGFTSC